MRSGVPADPEVKHDARSAVRTARDPGDPDHPRGARGPVDGGRSGGSEWTFRSVDSSRQTWEDRVNASFAKVKSPERVCFHADVTVRQGATGYTSVCDYCPAFVVSSLHAGPQWPAPWYFKDEDPLMI